MAVFLVWSMLLVVGVSMAYAWARWRDVFHPMIIVGPMFAFLYWYMPFRLLASSQLFDYLDSSQLIFVQTLNLAGVLAFILGCNAGSQWLPQRERPLGTVFYPGTFGYAALIGTAGLVCWWITIQNTGGLKATFSTSYSGGWSDNGYVRDAAYLLFSAIIVLFFYPPTRDRMSKWAYLMLAAFAAPWALQAVLGAKRGPLFELATTLALGFFLSRRRRPKLSVVIGGGVVLGYLMLFLLTNRAQLYLGSDFDLTADVSHMSEGGAGNEYIYGAGSVINVSDSRSFFWGKRYLAYLFIRPIPSIWWPTKYEDVGLGALVHNAGTAGSGFNGVFSWQEAEGAAPGIVADLWVECWWGAVPAMLALGYLYGAVWRRGAWQGGIWGAQYVVLISLSAFLILQTMEAVIVRCLLLSAPLWLAEQMLSRRCASRTRISAAGEPTRTPQPQAV